MNSILTKDGKEREIEWHDAVLTDPDEELIGLLCTGTDVTDRLRLEQEMINASEEERRRIVQDLHDDLGSLLTGIDFRMKAMTGKMSKQGHEDMAETSRAIQQLLQGAIKKSRAISRGLHAVGEHPEDLMTALEELAQRLKDISYMRCQFRCPEPVLVHDPIVANHLFRIAQEAANNAVKYSNGTQLTISLLESEGQITLRTIDNGIGFDCTEGGSRGLGLHTMSYRASAIGGRLIIGRRKRGGAKVVCMVPIHSREEELNR